MKRLIYFLIPFFIFGFLGWENKAIPDNQLVLLPVEEDPTISFRIWFKVGSQNDPRGKEGLAYLTSQMLVQGSTLSKSYEKILEELYPMAARYSAQVDKEMVVITGRVHKDNLEQYYQLLKEAIFTPAFDEKDFQRIKSEALNYLEKYLRYADEEELGKAALYEFIFQGTPYQHPNIGYVNSLKSITIQDVKEFYNKYFIRDNVMLGLAGGFDDKFVKEVKEDFAQLPPGEPTPVAPPQAEEIKGFEVLIVQKPTNSTAISMGFPVEILRGDEDFYPLVLVNSWLGEHRNSSSHLYQVIREARGLNYGDYSYIEHFPMGGRRQFPPPNVARRQQIFEIWIRPVESKYGHFAARAAVRELTKLVDHGLSREAFKLTKEFLRKYYLHYAPTLDYKLGYMMDDVFYGISGNYLQLLPQKLADLTLEQVNQTIKKHLQDKNIKIVFVTQDAEGLKKALIEDLSSPITYRTPKSQEILEEDKEIIKFPMKVSPEHIHIIKVSDIFEKPLKELL
ncbi:MAG: M16 family metallopeptidase [Candidatus Aminicenantia bacterium]